MRQPVRLAATLVHDLPLLVLDEPSRARILPSGSTCGASSAALPREGRTILVSSHILEEVDDLADGST